VIQGALNVWLYLGLLYNKGVTNQSQDANEYAEYDLGNSSNDRRDAQYAVRLRLSAKGLFYTIS